jgi:Concanavalin A-like lectin/glucanases superfamily/PEP-CTERM motif
VALFARGNGVQAGFTELISRGFSGGPGFYIGTDGSGSLMRAADAWTSTGAAFGTPNVWTHYALVVDSNANTSKLYVGGTLAAQVPYAIVTSIAGTPTRLGRQFDPFTEFFNGSIDEVRTYDGMLTAQDVATLAVPEPASWLLMALRGLAVVAAARRRQAG